MQTPLMLPPKQANKQQQQPQGSHVYIRWTATGDLGHDLYPSNSKHCQLLDSVPNAGADGCGVSFLDN